MVYKKIFPSSKLADKPKPWRKSLLLEVVYGRWTLIRHSVVSKFWRFKDAEYGTLFNLLDNYIPLVLSIYSISFKLNHFSEYFRAMIRIWIMFTCLKRRHYNKAPLVWINMCAHWGKHSTNLYQLLRNYIAIFDEYPVENTHTILCAQSKPSDTAEQLRKKSKQIFQSKEQQDNFRSHFTSPSQFSFSQNQLKFLKVKCAQILCSIFTQISSSPGQSSFFSNRNTGSHVTHVKSPNIRQNNPVKMSVLPLGYHTQVRADQTKQCDLPDCENSNPNEDWILLTGCFHSFHKTCLNDVISCPLSKDFLKDKIEELGKIAKQALFNPSSSSYVADNREEGSDAGLDSLSETTAIREMGQDEFNNVIRQLNNGIATTTQPQVNLVLRLLYIAENVIILLGDTADLTVHRFNVLIVHKTSALRTHSGFSSCTCSWHRNQNKAQSVTQAASTQQINVIRNQHMDVTEWLLPSYICQSTIGGRLNGSNACTVIAMLTASHFLENTISIPQQLQDLKVLIPIYSHLIFKGNHIYSSFNVPAQQPNLDVKDVLHYNHDSFQKIKLAPDVGIFTTEDLKNYLTSYQQQNQQFPVALIVPPDRTMVLCFHQTSICLFESHKHGHQGGISLKLLWKYQQSCKVP
ncbi:hypothetical protein P5673_027730 [Acropora cervicornis]|uniref:Uncharacterized protein n=1 Tax=Acropora cervicornis TaxID=6130 RepID=A0AAD9PYE1_ACRCE|nr:hypothetical protein P5673_027730 [Acropora cervicornis]